MAQPPEYLAPVLGSSTQEPGAARRVRALPHDLLMQASHRLAIISVIGASLWALSTVLYNAAAFLQSGALRFPSAADGICVFAIACSVALYAFSRKCGRNPALLLDAGLVYMVLTCADISLVLYLDPVWKHLPVLPTVTWNGAIPLLFAAIIPAQPGKMAAAAALAVCLNPLAFIYGRYAGEWSGTFGDISMKFFPDVLLAGTAVMVSHVVIGLGRQVTKAREMGSYRMVSLLGKGGMGEVWRASHRMLARDAAVKLIHPYMLQRNGGERAETLRMRFEQEARATASLRSPHTVELYDFGVTSEGVFYYAMEYLDGIDLQTLVRKFGPQPPARVTLILRQVCRSLGEAHRRGMVHRDIKPTNILLCRMGEEFDFVKVLDFGLVKILDNTDVQLTRNDTTLGTPAFMAPELALDSSAIDGRADLYSLGAVGYWLLTGALVFEENGPTATMMAHIQKTPLPPSQRTELPVPAGLEQVILMCLAKEAEQRPASAGELARRLEECGDEGWSRETAENWWRTCIPGEGVKGEVGDGEETASVDAPRH